MAFTESQVAGTELERVSSKVAVAFESDAKFFNSVKKRPAEVISNRQMRVPIELRPGGSFGYFNPDGGDLGRGGGPTFDKAVLNCVFMKEAIEYTKLAQWSADDARKAVINSVRKLVTDSTMEIMRQIDSQCMQTGTGVIGTITTSTPTGTSYDTYTLTTDGFGARLMRYGQTVQVFDSTLTTNRGSGEITFWDVANKTVQVSPAITGSTTGDLIVTQGISTPTALPGLYGVPYHDSNASTGVWLGFSRATTPEVRSNRINGGGAALTLPLPRQAINAMGNRVGIDNSFNPMAWTHPCQAQAYEQIGQLVSIIQKAPKEEGLNMYFQASNMQLAGAPLRLSFNWDTRRIDFITESLWGRAEILPIGFYKVDGRNIFEIRGPSGGIATADIFYQVVGMQLYVTNPAGTAYIDNLAVPSGY